jgi:hypothetical protein
MADDLKEFEVSFRLAALEIVVTDFLAAGFLQTPDPNASANAYREKLRNVMAVGRVGGFEADPDLGEAVSGEVADCIDKLLEIVQRTVAVILETKQRGR